MNDEQIVGLYFARAEAALTETEAQYGRLCLSVARRILPDERDAEECASDALLREWNAIPPERPRSLGAYLARLTRNLALDRYAYNQAEKRSTALTGAFEELEPFLPDAADSLQQAAECAELRQVLGAFLRRQTREARVFFVRRYWYGESIREVAQACGVSEEKVKASLFRTRNKLRAVLEKEGVFV